MQIQPYLFFNGHCEAAIRFYETALGASVDMLLRNRDNPEPPPPGTLPEGSDDKILHCNLRIGDTQLMMSDGRCQGGHAFQGFALSLVPADADEAGRLFAALADGGQVLMPLGKTFWSPCFGMVTDRFGVTWMLNVAA